MTATGSGYRTPARLLHWIVALLVLMMIPAGFVMVQEGISRSLQNTLFIFHKNVGVFVLLLVAVRFAYRRLNPPPPLPPSMPHLQHRIAALTHGALYALLFLMPVAGYVRVRAGGFPVEWLDRLGVPALVPRSEELAQVAKSVHLFGAVALTALVALHVGAALFHAIIRRDGVFSRMWPPVNARGAASPLATAESNDS
jgi:cytochrome b561